MPRLDDVTQRFEADTAPYIEAINLATQAAREFAAANAEALASVRELQSAMRDMNGAAASTALAVRGVAGAEDEARNSSALLEAILAELRNQTVILGAGFTFLDDKLAELVGYAQRAEAALADLRFAMYATAFAAANTVAAIYKTNTAMAAAPAAAGLAIRGFRLTGAAIHWLISGTAELLAIVLPAAIAASAGAFVLYQGVVEIVGRQVNSIRAVMEALGGTFHKTAGDVLGLGHSFQTAQNLANPIAYELLGNAIAAMNTHMGNLAHNGLLVGQALGELSARIVVDLNSQAGQFNALLGNMVKDLIGLGQILGNVGHAILNFASAMPGLAEVLLGIAVAITKIILAISQLPGWIITAVLVMEEMYRWGGLLVLMLMRIPAALALLAAAPIRFLLAIGEYLRAIAALALLAAANILKLAIATVGELVPALGAALAELQGLVAEAAAAILAMGALATALIGAAVLGYGALVWWGERAANAAIAWIGANDRAIQSASNLKVLGVIATSIGQSYQQAAHSAQTLAQSQTVAAGTSGALAARIGVTSMQTFGNVVALNAANAATQRWRGQLLNAVAGADYLSRAYGVNFTSALALADAAGVKLANGILGTSKAAQIARQQIAGLIAGYGALAAKGDTLSNDFAAMTLAAGLQASKVSQLNQAWDTFLGLSTNLTSSFATLITDTNEISNAIVPAGTRFTVFGGRVMSSVQAASYALRGFQGTSAQVWQNYDQALQQAGTFTDNLRIAQATGAVTTKQFTQEVAYAAQQLLPYAEHSKLATQELSALVQEAGGPATDSYQKLKSWIDHNTTSTGNFNRIMQQELGQLTNVNQAAQAFASTLQSDLIQQLATAGIKFSSINGLINTYAQMIQNGTNTTAAGQGIRAKLISDLKAAGFTAQQAAALINQMAAAISGLQSKTVTITTVYNSVPGTSTSPNPMTRRYQSGGLVIGPGGADRVPAMLTAGEAILTPQAVRMLGLDIINQLNSGFFPGYPMQRPGRGGGGEGGGFFPGYPMQLAGPPGLPGHALGYGSAPPPPPPRFPGGLRPGGPGGGTPPSVLTAPGPSSGSEVDRLQLVLKVEVMLDGVKIGQANRTDTLIYNRRNPTNALALRVR